MDTVIFFKGLGVAILTVILCGGLLYWCKFIFKKLFPNFKYWIKYKIFRKKYDEETVQVLLEYLDEGVSENDLYKEMLVDGKLNQNQAKEVLYIYTQIKKLKKSEKGGNKDE